MKPAALLCALSLVLLTACGGEKTASISLCASVTPTVFCDLTSDQLPAPLAQISQEDVALYGLPAEDTLILREGNQLTAYWLPWLGPAAIPPQLFSGDYDRDGEGELLILTYTGSGTGVSLWDLTLLERTGDGWDALTLSGTAYQDTLPPLLDFRWDHDSPVLSFGDTSLPISLPDTIEPGEPLEPLGGTVVSYEVEGNVITSTLDIGVLYGHFASHFCARLEGQLVYDGEGFSLIEPQFSLLEQEP